MIQNNGTNNNNNQLNRYVYVNDEYLMSGGVFANNPFHKQYKMNRIVGYLMGNPEKSKSRIARLMRKTGYRRYTGQVVEDIYGYAMDFHSNRQGDDFRPNYHNTSDYIIEQYIDIALTKAINSFNRKKLLNKKTRESNILDIEDYDSEKTYDGTILSNQLETDELETSRTELDYFYECFDYLMAIVDNTKPRNQRLMPELVYDIFLSGYDRVDIRRQITRREGYYELGEEYYTDIDNQYQLTERQVKAWMNRIKKSEDIEPFKEMTKELVLAITEGNFMREDIINFQFEG